MSTGSTSIFPTRSWVCVRAIGSGLQERRFGARRALLLYPQGLDFICGFLGCMAADVVAVPAPLPQLHELDRALRWLRQIIADADITVVLTTRPVLEGLRSGSGQFSELAALPWIATDEVDEAAAGWRSQGLAPESTAFVQYTSGSTSAPRGVVVSHANLLHNQSAIAGALGHTPELVSPRSTDGSTPPAAATRRSMRTTTTSARPHNSSPSAVATLSTPERARRVRFRSPRSPVMSLRPAHSPHAAATRHTTSARPESGSINSAGWKRGTWSSGRRCGSRPRSRCRPG